MYVLYLYVCTSMYLDILEIRTKTLVMIHDPAVYFTKDLPFSFVLRLSEPNSSSNARLSWLQELL